MLNSQLLDCSVPDFYQTQSGKIGPDPLREDADVEVVWNKMHNSKKPVGLVLMEQSMVAGIGNIYRAEILFKVFDWIDRKFSLLYHRSYLANIVRFQVLCCSMPLEYAYRGVKSFAL